MDNDSVKKLGTYITDIKSATGISSQDIVVEHRSNNHKRDYLFVNTKQGKHIPASPSESIKMFSTLASMVYEATSEHKLLVIGFAETATAIGNVVASKLDNMVYYTQTTREKMGIHALVEFEEKHSHAVQQALYTKTPLSEIDYDYILFVEDELSTGNTILDCIDKLNKVQGCRKYGVASVCNWQSIEKETEFSDAGIETFALIRGRIKNVNALMGDLKLDDQTIEYTGTKEFRGSLVIENMKNEREGYASYDYTKTVDRMISYIENRGFTGKDVNRVLVLGTEEFMFIPMMVGQRLESIGLKVYTHATTRSSIDVIKGSHSISREIVRKYKLPSAYEEGRQTFMYNLRRYDRVILITDGICSNAFITSTQRMVMNEGMGKNRLLIIAKGVQEV